MEKMIKKMASVALCIVIMVSLCACGPEDSDSTDSTYSEIFQENSSMESAEMLGSGKLIVNGQEIINESIDIHETYAKVPLTPILSALGYEITWGTSGFALIKYNEKTYILNLSAKTIKKEGSSENLLLQDKQSYYVCEQYGQELIIDEVTLYILMERMGTPVRVSLNYEDLTVSVSRK